MTQGIRAFTIANFNSGLAARNSKEVTDTQFRADVMDQSIVAFGISIASAATHYNHALKLAHRGYVMVNGKITLSGTGAELLARPEIRAAYLEGGRH